MISGILGYRNYQKAVQRLFNTPDGKVVLAHWVMDKVQGTAFNPDGTPSAAKLALKEFVQGLLNDVKNPADIDEIIYAESDNSN